MDKLLQGVDRFRRDVYPLKEKLFQSLAKEQQPQALFITCSDSRIDPNLVTQTEPGEIFVLRNAGNLVPKHDRGLGEAATIEYAVKALKIPNIIVCGHRQCGAMAALLDSDSCAELPAVEAWIKDARPRADEIRQRHAGVPNEKLLDLMVQENVINQLEALAEHPAVRDGLEVGSLILHGWVYCFVSGEVTVFDPAQRAFLPSDITSNPT